MLDNEEPPNNKRQETAMFSSSLSWDRLPDDLWHDILTHLVRRRRYGPFQSISLVCKRFLALSNRAVTFVSIKPSIKPVPLPPLFSRFHNITSFQLSRDLDLDASITLLANSGLPLQSLHLSDQTYFPKEAIRLLGDRMSGTLKSLSCVGFHVMTDDDLAVVTGCFPYLQQFDVQGHCAVDNFVTDQGIFEVSTKLKSLVSINLLYQERLTHRSLDYLVSNCPSLRNLQLGWINYIGMDQLDRLDLFRSLSSLHLNRAEFSQRVLVQLSKVGLKLEKLILVIPQVSSDVTGEILCKFFKSCRSLRCLHLCRFPFPPDTNAIDFAASLPNIQIIRLYVKRFIPPNTLFYLLKSCPLLEEIHIACNFLGIAQDWFNNASAKFLLRKLNFVFSDDLCDETLKLVVSVCPMLKKLCLIGCSKITQKGIEAVAASCNNIKFLYVGGSKNCQKFKLDRRDHF